jgi:hypothetical protein
MDDDGSGSGPSSTDDLLGSLLTRFSALGVASTEDDLVTQFALIFSIEKALARFFLDAGGMNLERSINIYLDNIGASRAPRAAVPPAPRGFEPGPQGGIDSDAEDDAEAAMLDSAIQASLLSSREREAAHLAPVGGGFAGFRSDAAAPLVVPFACGSAAPSFSFSRPAAVPFGGGTAPPSFSFSDARTDAGARAFVLPPPTTHALTQAFGPPAHAAPASDRTMEES